MTARIHRLIGQLKAIEVMVAKKRSCAEILNQIAAVRAGIETIGAIVFQRELERLRTNRRVTSEDIAKLTKLFSKTT